jgi:hypothetical protein
VPAADPVTGEPEHDGFLRRLQRDADRLLIADSDEFFRRAVSIAMHQRNCPFDHGPWNGLVEGCRIYAEHDQTPRSLWESEARRWLSRRDRRAPIEYQPPPAPITRPVDEVASPPGQPPPMGLPDMVDHAVHIGTYVGAAAAGGVIGNRTDAGLVAGVRRVLRPVRRWWRRRGRRRDRSRLTEEQAVESARALVAGRGYAAGSFSVQRVERVTDCWTIFCAADHLTAGNDRLRIRVPFAESARPSILIVNP